MTNRSRFHVGFCFAFALMPFVGCTRTSRPATAPTSTATATAPPTTKPAAVEPALTEAQRQKNIESFDIVWTTVRDKHFDPNYNGVDWNAVRTELRPKVEQAKSIVEARGVMQDMLGRLGQTHFGILPGSIYQRVSEAKKPSAGEASATSQPQADEEEDDDLADADDGQGSAGIDLRVVDGRAIVTRVEPDGAAAKAGVKPGWELSAVRGRPMMPIIADLAQALEGSTLLPAMQAQTVESTLEGRVGRKVTATFVDAGDKPVHVTIELIKPAGKLTKFGNLPPMRVRTETRRLDPQVEYFALSIFLDPGRVMSEYRKAIEAAATSSAAQADGLIIDLRGNPGGIGFMAVGMANHLVNKPGLKLGEMSSRSNPAFKFVIDPQPLMYDGPVAILIDECSMSTSEILAGGLRDIGRARVFGVRTAGAALPSTVEKLPNGDRFQYAVANYVSAGGNVLEAHGVEPDEKVAPDRAALLAGHDPTLDAAVKWVASQPKPVTK